MTEYSFSSSITLPGGRSIYVSIDVPVDVAPDQLADYSEFTQIAAANAMRNVVKSDELRVEAEREHLKDVVAQMTSKAPF